MKFTALAILVLATACLGQTGLNDHLQPEEISSAISAKPGTGFVLIEDGGFTTPTTCQSQMPSEAIFTPQGWLNVQNVLAKKQYLPFNPTANDTMRAITVISKGCASGTPSGPVCDSITRVVILSGRDGRVIVEPVETHAATATWQNGFGANAACSSLVSKFNVADVQRARNDKGEFLIATFGGATLLKTYTVKQKHLRHLGF